jgi:NAD(P)-dependent dehydrogenase (short-subunit alcohol dehydrogenase family)
MSQHESRGAVLITGASTGIGEACALRLARQGCRVFAGVRKEADGQALQARGSELIAPVFIDVADPESIAAARQSVADSVGDSGLVGVVNNAGVYFGGPLEFISLNGIRAEFEVNFFGAIAVTQAFLPLLRMGGGRIVNMSSISGLMAFPFMGPYASSKFALEALSDCWRVELRPWGIHVALVEPGDIDTPIWDKGIETLRNLREDLPREAHELYGPVFGLAEKKGKRGIPPDRVAEVVEHALFAPRPRIRYLVGSDAKFVSIFRKLPAWLRDRMISKKLPTYP